jgi:class 3 adenylate cyclase/tetratricopeptide (TPR) repeat protein
MADLRPPERRQLTVMLCDLVGWTGLSQRVDPEELAEVVQAYRQRCTTLITRHGGTVAQYVGDAVLAYFGYPRAHEDDAERAVRAALSIAAAERSASQVAGTEVHIGIATGIVVVGNLLGEGALAAERGADAGAGAEISAVGGALNLAARLQTLAEPGAVVVSEQTRRLTRGIFEYKDLGPHELKGFDAPVQAWRVVGESRARSRFHALRGAALTALVDREAEMQELRRIWESVREGHGRALLLTADPGVGKSRLTDEVATRIVGRQCLRLWYYCSPHLQGSPLAPLIRQLTQAVGFTDKDDDAAKLHKLEALVPGAAQQGDIVPLLAGLLSIETGERYPPLNISPQRRKHRLFEVLVSLLKAAASRRPVLVVVEDLHWIDPSSDELLGMAIDHLKGLPVLAIFTARPEFHPHWEDREQLVHMRLNPLDRSDALTMIGLLCGDRSVPERTIAQIADRADGLPLFIEDLTRDILEVAEARPGAGATERALSSFAIPATLNDSLMSRLDRLGSAKAVAQIGAAIGREFPYELLARVAARPQEEVKEDLYRLVEAGLVMSRPSASVRMYGFKHALVRDAAYSSLLKKDQAALHARVAQSLVDDFPEVGESQPEVLAHHFQAAGDIDNAVHHLARAAKLSAARSGFVEAIGQLRSALALLATQAESQARMRQELRLHLALGGVYAEHRGFSSAECGGSYNAALDLCRALGEAPEIFVVLSGVGSFEITRANFPKCRALAEECLSRAAQQASGPPFIMGHLLLGGTMYLTGEFAAARGELQEALRLYEEHERDRMARRGRQVLYVQDQKSTGLCYLALALTSLGFLDSGLRAAQEGLGHSRSLGGLHTINYSLCYLAAVHQFRRDSRESLQYATESLEMAREQGFATWIGVSLMIRGDALIAEGNIAEGIGQVNAGLAAHDEIAAVTYRPYGMALLANGLMVAGRLDGALDVLAQALAMIERTGERFYLAELLRLKGEVLARRGSHVEAEVALREAIELSRLQGARLFELRSSAGLCRLLDGARRAYALREVLEPVYASFDEGVDAPDVRDARVLLTR